LEVVPNVVKLADYGRVSETNGSAQRPVVWYGEIDAELPLTPLSGREHNAKA